MQHNHNQNVVTAVAVTSLVSRLNLQALSQAQFEEYIVLLIQHNNYYQDTSKTNWLLSSDMYMIGVAGLSLLLCAIGSGQN